MSRRSSGWVAGLLLACMWMAPTGAAAEVGGLPSLPAGLRLLPSGPATQFDDGGMLSFIPKGEFAQDAWEWPLVAGQFLSSAAVNVGSIFLFSHLASSDAGRPVDEARRALLMWGLVQLAATPLASSSAVWGVGSLSDIHAVSFGWPLLVNYAVELLLVAMKVGVGYGLIDLKGADVVAGVQDLLGPFLIIDWLLHGLVVPATVTYFSLRSRTAVGFSFARREAPLPARALDQPSVRSVVDRRAESVRADGVTVLPVPLLALRF